MWQYGECGGDEPLLWFHFRAIAADLRHLAPSLRTEKDNRVTPAMAAGVARRPMTVEELVGLLDSN